MKQNDQQPEEKILPTKTRHYEAPAVIYSGTITTRAGSPVGNGEPSGVDPADLFGN